MLDVIFVLGETLFCRVMVHLLFRTTKASLTQEAWFLCILSLVSILLDVILWGLTDLGIVVMCLRRRLRGRTDGVQVVRLEPSFGDDVLVAH